MGGFQKGYWTLLTLLFSGWEGVGHIFLFSVEAFTCLHDGRNYGASLWARKNQQLAKGS